MPSQEVDSQQPVWRLYAVAAAAGLLIAALYIAFRPKPPETPSTVTPAAQQAREYPRDWKLLVASARNGHFPSPPPDPDLHPLTGKMRDDATAPAMSPAGVIVETTRPHFTWPHPPGSTAIVTVVDKAGRPIHSEPLLSGSWTCTRDLERGMLYTWQVEIHHANKTQVLPSPPADTAVFRVLSQQGAHELREARRQFPDDALLVKALQAKYGVTQ